MLSGKPVRVVIAVDQAIYRRGLAAVITSLDGVQLIGEAKDAEEAVQLCALVEPDIIFFDLKASLAEGVEVYRTIHRRWPQIKIALMTDLPSANRIEGRQQADTTYHFSKDISEEEFAAAVKRIAWENLPEAKEIPADLSAEEHRQPALIESQDEVLASTDLSQGRISQQDGEILSRELVMAGKIQAEILPEKPPAIPGWDISAKLEPARETSGDFYDFIPLANGSWGIVIADVSEKGMGAALFMAMSNTLIRTFAIRYPSLPALTMDVVNERILSDTRGSMFVTAFYGVLEPHLGRLRFVNAGHPPAYLISNQKGKPVDQLRSTGMALGVMENAHWQQRIVKLSIGEVLVFYTDGITEAQDPKGSFYGKQRLLDVIRSKASCPASEIQDAVLSDVHHFVADTPRQDDIAIIVICRKG